MAASDIDVWTHRDDRGLSPEVVRDVLAPDELLRADRLRDAEQRRRWAASRCFLRNVLSQYVDDRAETIRIDVHPNGKPTLTDYPECHFSLSHAAGVSVVAVTTLGPLGVDIEPIRPYAELRGAVTLSMTSREQYVLDALPEGDRVRSFLHGWTCKEAVLKATGTGINDQLLRLEVSLNPADSGVQSWDGRPSDDWCLIPFEPYPGYLGAVAIEHPNSDDVRLVQQDASPLH